MKDKILQLYSEGKSYREIQRLLGCSKGTIAYHVGMGQKRKTLERTRTKREKIRRILQEMKAVPCTDCGEEYPFWVMEFDHINPNEKEFDLSDHGRTSTSVIREIIKEAKKCEVVCSNCHKTRTHYRHTTTLPNYGWKPTEELVEQYTLF